MSSKLHSYLRLVRTYNAPFHGAIPALGAIAMGMNSIPHILLIFAIGMMVHAFFAVTNEIMDVDEDKRGRNLVAHPLASEDVPIEKARLMGIIFPSIAVVLAVLAFEGSAVMVFLLMAIALFAFYNIVNKAVPGTEFILVSAFASLALFGCAAGGLTNAAVAIFFSAAAGLHALATLTIYLGMWTVQFRSEDSKLTLAALLGARKRGGRFITTTAFLSYGTIIQTLFFGAVLFPFLFGGLPFTRGHMVLLILFVLGSTMVTYRLLMAQLYKPREIVNSAVVHYVLVGASLPLMMAGISPWVVVFAIFPLVEVFTARHLTGSSILSPVMGTMPPRKEDLPMDVKQ